MGAGAVMSAAMSGRRFAVPIDDKLQTLWEEQRAFNLLLRKPPDTLQERTQLTKEFCLHMFSEIDELLRASGAWKFHRNVPPPNNLAHLKEELADILKLWICVCQAWGLDPDQAIDAAIDKSAVVRQRYCEEWILSLDGP